MFSVTTNEMNVSIVRVIDIICSSFVVVVAVVVRSFVRAHKLCHNAVTQPRIARTYRIELHTLVRTAITAFLYIPYLCGVCCVHTNKRLFTINTMAAKYLLLFH